MPTARVNGIDVHYMHSEGNGPRLLYFNGSGTTLATTGPMIKPFADAFELVAHDQRGLGETTIPPGPYTMAEYAADAAALIDHIGWETCRVVGVSFGGMVAQEFAVTWPERVERLALVCTSPGGAGGASYPLHTMADMTDDERAAIGATLLDTRFTPEWLATHDVDRMMAEMMASRSSAGGGGDADPEVARGMREQLLARKDHDVWDRLPRIACPTLVAAGRYDGIAPLANNEAMAARIPGSELKVYEGGHAFTFQDPAAIPDIVGFLSA